MLGDNEAGDAEEKVGQNEKEKPEKIAKLVRSAASRNSKVKKHHNIK